MNSMPLLPRIAPRIARGIAHNIARGIDSKNWHCYNITCYLITLHERKTGAALAGFCRGCRLWLGFGLGLDEGDDGFGAEG